MTFLGCSSECFCFFRSLHHHQIKLRVRAKNRGRIKIRFLMLPNRSVMDYLFFHFRQPCTLDFCGSVVLRRGHQTLSGLTVREALICLAAGVVLVSVRNRVGRENIRSVQDQQPQEALQHDAHQC